MLKIRPPLTFISDPAHGWLQVPLADIAVLAIEEDISSCSFINGRFAYLEEDCDYGIFIAAAKAQDTPLPEIIDQYIERFDRDRPRFGDPQFSPGFWDKLRH